MLPRLYAVTTETLLRDVCCENTSTSDGGGTRQGRARNEESHREYYIPSTPRYTASHSVSFGPTMPDQETLQKFFYALLLVQRSTTTVPLLGEEPPDILDAPPRLTPRERARDSSSIVPSSRLLVFLATAAVRCCLASVGKTSFIVRMELSVHARVLVSRHLFTGCRMFVCLPCCAR